MTATSGNFIELNRLWKCGKTQHISDGLECSFEEGSFEGFQAWLNSNDEGWLNQS